MLLWLDYLKDLIHEFNPKTEVIGICDAGIFMDSQEIIRGDHI